MENLISLCSVSFQNLCSSRTQTIFQNAGVLIYNFEHTLHICSALRDLVALVQFKKREKYSWRSVSFIKVAGLNLQLY